MGHNLRRKRAMLPWGRSTLGLLQLASGRGVPLCLAGLESHQVSPYSQPSLPSRATRHSPLCVPLVSGFPSPSLDAACSLSLPVLHLWAQNKDELAEILSWRYPRTRASLRRRLREAGARQRTCCPRQRPRPRSRSPTAMLGTATPGTAVELLGPPSCPTPC